MLSMNVATCLIGTIGFALAKVHPYPFMGRTGCETHRAELDTMQKTEAEGKYVI